jgi:hypothetical protein
MRLNTPSKVRKSPQCRRSVTFQLAQFLCSLDAEAYDPAGCRCSCGALGLSLVLLPVFLQRNLGRIFGGTPVNSLQWKHQKR